MTIHIYPGQRPSKPIESHPWAGTIAGWFESAGIDYAQWEVQPVSVTVDGAPVPVELWADTVVTNDQVVAIAPYPFGGIGKIFSKVFNLLFGWLLPKTGAGKRNDPGQGKQLQTADGKANTAKLNQTVPELFGKFIRYPDYLVPPRRRFDGPRTQNLEMLLCVGPGRYQIDPARVKIGNTPLASMEGAEFTVHEPGADLSLLEMAQNWYPAPEVGGTSAGTAGLDLTATADTSINPTGSSYVLAGGGVITSDVDFPASWGVSTAMSLMFRQPVTITRINVGTLEEPIFVNELEGDWREISPVVNQMLNASGVHEGSARVRSVAVNSAGYGKITLSRFVDGDPGSWQRISDLPLGNQSIAVSRAGQVYLVESVSGTQVTVSAQGVSGWSGFAPRTVPAAGAAWGVRPGTVYGEQAGPFVILPAAEKTSVFEIDFFFPQGLHYMEDDGDVRARSVGVAIEYRDAAGGSWQSLSKTYTEATLDQIGFTERITLGAVIRPEVRIRRRGARASSTQVQDVIQWYAARCLLPAPTGYPWTTLSVKVRGLGQIAASSENQINLEAVRILPTLQPDGSWGPEVPTRDVSAAVWRVCSTIGYGVDSVDIPELLRLHNIWAARGETFDAVLDETTVQQAIETAFASGMAELALEDGKVRPVRDGLRTIAEQSYSAHNVLEGIRRQFTAHRPDDNDGVEVEFQDEADGWATATVRCMLPGSLGLKLQKVKLPGVTDRTRAWRIGMRRAREQRYQRWNYSFSTELDALNSGYGAFVSLVGDQSAILQQITQAPGGMARLHVTEPLRWKAGDTHVVAFRRPDGSPAGPWLATPGSDEFELLAPIPQAEWPAISLRQEPPHVYFGPQNAWHWPALVRSVKPGSSDTCAVQAVNYDPRLYDDDDNSPPAE